METILSIDEMRKLRDSMTLEEFGKIVAQQYKLSVEKYNREWEEYCKYNKISSHIENPIIL